MAVKFTSVQQRAALPLPEKPFATLTLKFFGLPGKLVIDPIAEGVFDFDMMEAAIDLFRRKQEEGLTAAIAKEAVQCAHCTRTAVKVGRYSDGQPSPRCEQHGAQP